MGNRLMQFMTAHSIARRVPGCQLSNIDTPEFNLSYAQIGEDHSYKLTFTHSQEIGSAGRIEVENVAHLLNCAALRRVVLAGYCQHVANFGSADEYREILPLTVDDAAGCGPDELLINIRMGDVADGHHRDYVSLPVEFYAEVVRTTGLLPVFLGQIEDNPYCRSLQRLFPEARFVPSEGARRDFARIRRSKNILLSISTFSWVAAWLSEAERIIMPVAGVFHPLQHPSSNLIPLGDRRYTYYLFPIHHSVPVAEAADRHGRLQGLWRLVSDGQVRDITSKPRYAASKADFIRVFDEAYYLQSYLDVRSSVELYGLPSGLTHFVSNGFDEGRRAFEIDERWYFANYLIAAIEVGQGDYRNAADHYAAIGALRGYRPLP